MEAAKPAMFYNKSEDLKVHCHLCPHNCTIKPGSLGVCRARKNIDGNLYSLNYGKISSIALDPIEKKPLYRFKSGSRILSIGTFGCNLKCSFCQNWEIAHDEPELYDVTSEYIVNKAKELMPQGNIGIAYTYNEPSVWYEFVYDTSVLAKKEGLSNVLVTNGFIGKEALLMLLPYIDAMNIDVKAYTSSFYKDICGGALENVKETVKIAVEKCHVEVTTLVIPTLNDDLKEISEIAKWLSSLSRNIPLHLSRFFPNYKMQSIPPTPKETLYRAQEEAQKYLEYVYLGNIW
ncbi:MAG TPA: AmmeMemoRadiSam system radical SAM enzyme [Acetivibrio sp.]|uniref:AmmeMemoRadiSam system radical SAM enzyme n=1 Tax=Acetivibrio sp. TaxID=1872092 RepID=UPI002C7ACF5E|nr:AmmeMemoRadiSam system radical SAM enzyme [Acetivibrio sp.]HOM03151.1 AmmeMemoRadiSam system radical SAM enzyme [Acetivibrio sp.]